MQSHSAFVLELLLVHRLSECRHSGLAIRCPFDCRKSKRKNRKQLMVRAAEAQAFQYRCMLANLRTAWYKGRSNGVPSDHSAFVSIAFAIISYIRYVNVVFVTRLPSHRLFRQWWPSTSRRRLWTRFTRYQMRMIAFLIYPAVCLDLRLLYTCDCRCFSIHRTNRRRWTLTTSRKRRRLLPPLWVSQSLRRGWR